MRVLAEKELHELTRLYPAVAIDAARARMYKLDRTTQERINRIAIAAHGLLYKRRRTKVLPTLMRFFSTDYPRHFRRLWPYVVFSVAMFFVSGLGAYVTVQLRPSLIHVFIAEQLDMVDGEKGMSAEDMSERYRRMPHAPMAAGLMVNNISVAFNAFAFGITGGIGTCYVLLVNGTMLGAFIAHFTNHNQAYACWANLTPHGVLEIMAILIAGGAGLRMGLSLAIPGALTRKASLRAGAKDAVFLVLGTIPMFVIAGIIEGFVTPSYISGDAKIAVGLITGTAALAYLLLLGRARPAAGSGRPGIIAGGPTLSAGND
ncbi:MAG: stage II sporulation protein M [Planctomycetes bacterium]|nr:stage II sporulation protein M [Planctomycetota bacterium]